jgi:hypothetical protein
MFSKHYAIVTMHTTGETAGALSLLHADDSIALFESFDDALSMATAIGGPNEVAPNGELPGYLVQIVELSWREYLRLKWWQGDDSLMVELDVIARAHVAMV